MPEFWDQVLLSVGESYTLTVGHVVSALTLLLVGWLVARLLSGFVARRLGSSSRLRPDDIQIIQRVVFYTAIALVGFAALSILQVPLTAFAFLSGTIAIGLGFGAQNVINNFISGWILLMERPVRINDFIEVDNHHGVVERIGNRSTRIRRTDGVHLLMPNSQMLERVVINWTLVDNHIRTIVRVGVAYGSDVKLVAKLIDQAVNDQPEVQADPAPSVILEDFGDNAVVFDSYFWCEVGGEGELRKIRSEIRFRISELFHDNGIVIAFPQRDLHLDTLTPLEIRMIDSDQHG